MDDLYRRRCYGRGIDAVTGDAGAITELRGAKYRVWALLRGAVRVWCGALLQSQRQATTRCIILPGEGIHAAKPHCNVRGVYSTTIGSV